MMNPLWDALARAQTEARAIGREIDTVHLERPEDLGSTYIEMVESLKRIGAAGVRLQIDPQLRAYRSVPQGKKLIRKE